MYTIRYLSSNVTDSLATRVSVTHQSRCLELANFLKQTIIPKFRRALFLAHFNTLPTMVMEGDVKYIL